MVRVTKIAGRVIYLETCLPSKKLFGSVYRFYLFHSMPPIGALVSRKKYAYTYLLQSIVEFITLEELKKIMEKSGLRDIQTHSFSWGIAAAYIDIKKAGRERQ